MKKNNEQAGYQPINKCAVPPPPPKSDSNASKPECMNLDTKKKKYKFDLNLFLKICKENGATISEGNGGIFVDGKPIDIVEEIEKELKDIGKEPGSAV